MSTWEPVGDVVAGLGESPCWDAANAHLLWVDIPGGLVHRTDPADGSTVSTPYDGPVSLLTPTCTGSTLAAVGNKLLDGAETVAALPQHPQMRFNDGGTDPRGRLFVGTMHTAKEPGTASLYRLDGERLTTVLDRVTVSNGLGWSPDASTLYYVDTPTLRIEAIDYEITTGTLGERTVFADVATSGGRPDGLSVDSEGCVWVALIGGGALHRYRPDGKLDRVLPLPVSHPTSCAFGGVDGDELYVTTAIAPLTEAERAREPLAGQLLFARPGVEAAPSVPARLHHR